MSDWQKAQFSRYWRRAPYFSLVGEDIAFILEDGRTIYLIAPKAN